MLTELSIYCCCRQLDCLSTSQSFRNSIVTHVYTVDSGGPVRHISTIHLYQCQISNLVPQYENLLTSNAFVKTQYKLCYEYPFELYIYMYVQYLNSTGIKNLMANFDKYNNPACYVNITVVNLFYCLCSNTYCKRYIKSKLQFYKFKNIEKSRIDMVNRMTFFVPPHYTTLFTQVFKES